jgi:hypothetical protein
MASTLTSRIVPDMTHLGEGVRVSSVAFRHRSQLCERPALLAHVFVRRHRPPTSGLNLS